MFFKKCTTGFQTIAPPLYCHKLINLQFPVTYGSKTDPPDLCSSTYDKNEMFLNHFYEFFWPIKMWIKNIVLNFLLLTEVFGTPIYNKGAKLTLDDCWQIWDYVTYWRTSFAIAATILTTILLGGIIWFVLYCRSKRNRQ